MGDLLAQLLGLVEVCVISGGQFEQFRTQVVERLPALDEAQAARLHLMPTCGTQYWRRARPDDPTGPDGRAGQDAGWIQVYAENLTDDQKHRVLTALEEQARRLGLWETETWGPILEDRGSQITFSALGQAAPVDAKRAWDPTGERKSALRAAVAALVPDLEVRSGGSTSVDITRMGIDKAYGMRRLVEITGIPLDDMLFVGDRLDPDGNDYPVKALGVRTHAVGGWTETADYLETLIADLRAQA